MSNLIYLEDFTAFVSEFRLRGVQSLMVAEIGKETFIVFIDGVDAGENYRYVSRTVQTREEAMEILHKTFATLRQAGVVSGDYLTGVCDNKDAKPLVLGDEDAAKAYQQAMEMDLDEILNRHSQNKTHHCPKCGSEKVYGSGLCADCGALCEPPNDEPTLIQKAIAYQQAMMRDQSVEPLKCPECGSLDSVGNWDCPKCGYLYKDEDKGRDES